ncbi:CynX/NimT family MFS transporter [Streptomyces sp. NPDC094038]|uniref:CynX/NimT family MFS transporter n=1 Tax=Streptomyces sp. NPDC094038 TaxID=3366055 RepID=UPI00381DBE29
MPENESLVHESALPSVRATQDTPDHAAGVWTRRLAVAALLVAAVNLRPGVTSLGPVLQEVRHGLGMSGAVAGLLTAAPMLCFSLFGVASPRLERRLGPGAVVFGGMCALTAGLLLRTLAGTTATFLAASALSLAGLAVANVMMPVIVKHYFPDRVGSMTGLYSMGISIGTGTAAAVTAPLTDALGGDWRLGLGAWALPAALTIPFWVPLVRDRAGTAPAVDVPTTARVVPQAPAAAATGSGRLIRSRTAWAMAIFFGLQASGIYCIMGWLAQIFRDTGISADEAGLLLAVAMAVSVPVSLFLPALAGKMRRQGALAVALAAFGLGGYIGLWLAPAALPWLWAFLIGVANCSFPLALTLIGMRARTDVGVVKLSAFAQCTGYLLSIPGPILMGALYQHSDGWGAPIALMVAMLVPQTVAGILAGRDRSIEDEW